MKIGVCFEHHMAICDFMVSRLPKYKMSHNIARTSSFCRVFLFFVFVQLGEAGRRATNDAGWGSHRLVPDADAPPRDVGLAAGSVQVDQVGRAVHVGSVDLNDRSCQLGQLSDTSGRGSRIPTVTTGSVDVDSDHCIGRHVGEVDVVLGVVEGEGVLEEGDVPRESLGGHQGPSGRDGGHGGEGGALLEEPAEVDDGSGRGRRLDAVLRVRGVVVEGHLGLRHRLGEVPLLLVLRVVVEVGVVERGEGHLGIGGRGGRGSR